MMMPYFCIDLLLSLNKILLFILQKKNSLNTFFKMLKKKRKGIQTWKILSRCDHDKTLPSKNL